MSKGASLTIFSFSLVLFIFGLGLLLSSWGIRENMIYLQDWKATYESGYCPTCGNPIDRHIDEKENFNE